MPDVRPDPPEAEPGRTEGWRRLGSALGPRRGAGQLVVGLLFALLGFGVALQVSSTADDDLADARETDLVRILDDLSQREQRLRAEASDLQATRDELANGSDQAATALEESRERAESLGILSGTLPATGPGIVMTVSNSPVVDAALVLDTIQELRDAGAEVIQVGDVRVVASTYVVDGAEGGVVVDGTALTAPYVIKAIGEPRTLSAALRIPGGVLDSVRSAGADAVVDERDTVDITALRTLPTPEHARPASED